MMTEKDFVVFCKTLSLLESKRIFGQYDFEFGLHCLGALFLSTLQSINLTDHQMEILQTEVKLIEQLKNED